MIDHTSNEVILPKISRSEQYYNSILLVKENIPTREIKSFELKKPY